MFKYGFILFATLALTSCALIPETYQAAPISGQVVDEDTGKPLAGVNVVVYWKLYTGGFGGRVIKDILKVDETTTDQNGRYHFTGWGPLNVFSGRLGYEAPELLFSKPGYYYQRKGNSRTQMYFGERGAGEIHTPIAEKTDKGLIYRSQWDGATITLKPGKYADEKYIDNLEFLSRELTRIIRYKFSCSDKTAFGLIEEIRGHIKELDKLKIRHHLSNPDSISRVRGCKL